MIKHFEMFSRLTLVLVSTIVFVATFVEGQTSSVDAKVLGATTATAVSKPHDDAFVIGVDDVLAMTVWKDADISRAIPGRCDVRLSLPRVGELQAAGQTTAKLEV